MRDVVVTEYRSPTGERLTKPVRRVNGKENPDLADLAEAGLPIPDPFDPAYAVEWGDVDYRQTGPAHVKNDRPAEPVPVADRIARMGEHVVRIATGIESLDDAMLGGLPTRRRLIVIAPPGCGKTGLLVQPVLGWLRQGSHVAILSEDETADTILSRIGQRLGLRREDLEERDPDNPEASDLARAELVHALEGLPLYLFDGDDEPHPTVESVSLYLRDKADGAPSVLIADSVQTVRSATRGDADGPRGRIDGVMTALKVASRRDGHAVFATCESGRAGYRSRTPGENASAISQGKESGSIEYGTDVLLNLRPVKGSSTKVDAEISKNRVGHRGVEFRLQWQAEQCAFREVEGEDEQEDVAEVQRHEAVELKVLDAIRRNPGIKTANGVWKLTKARRTQVLAIVRDMLAEGRIEKTGQGLMVVGLVPEVGKVVPE